MHHKSLLALQPGVSLSELKSNVSPTRSWSSSGQTLGGSSACSSSNPIDKPKTKVSSQSNVVNLISDDEDDSQTEEDEAIPKATFKTKSQSDESDPVAGWAYIGSHNFTPAAWGNLSGSSSSIKMSQKNWELGAVIPVRKSDLDEKNSTSLARSAITYRRDYQAYGPNDHPWVSFMKVLCERVFSCHAYFHSLLFSFSAINSNLQR